MSKGISFFSALLLVTLFLVGQTLFIVPEQSQALVLQFGNPKQKIITPGLKAKVPFIQQVKFFDRRVLDLDPPPEEVILADQKRIVVDTFARYKIIDMLTFHQALSTEEQAASRLNNLINSTMRSTLGNTTMTDVLSEKRAALMDKIRKQVNDTATRLGIEIVDVRIGRADLPEQTSQSVYARMKTEREMEAAEFRAQGSELAQEIRSKADKERTILIADAEKQAQIMRGQGDEQAIKIYADAFQRDPEFFSFYRTMEAYKQSLVGSDTTLVLTPEGDFFRFFKNQDGKR